MTEINAFELGDLLRMKVASLQGTLIYPLDRVDKSLVFTIPKTSIRFVALRSIDDIARLQGWCIDTFEPIMEYQHSLGIRVHTGYKFWMRVI